MREASPVTDTDWPDCACCVGGLPSSSYKQIHDCTGRCYTHTVFCTTLDCLAAFSCHALLLQLLVLAALCHHIFYPVSVFHCCMSACWIRLDRLLETLATESSGQYVDMGTAVSDTHTHKLISIINYICKIMPQKCLKIKLLLQKRTFAKCHKHFKPFGKLLTTT